MKIFLKITFIVLACALVVTVGNRFSYADNALTGKVIESVNSAGYTYVQIDNNGKKTWLAIPETTIKKGQKLSFSPGMEMQNFESRSLKRKFDRIIFSGGVIGQQGKASEMKSPGSKGSAAISSEKIKVDKASGPNAYTVEELYKNSKKLNNKKIVVRGKVIKISSGVMKKNWIHIQDGSGNEKSGNYDLVVTSDALPVVGDIVTVSGTLYKNKDFGSGYKYAVIIENANIEN